MGLLAFGLFLLALDRSPVQFYQLVYKAGFGTAFSWQNTLSRAAPLLMAALFVTIFDLAICYPIAYYLAQSAHGGWGRLMVLSLIVPFWVNEILRAFAFRIMFGSAGVINTFLMWSGVIDQPYDFIPNNIALYAGLGYAYILKD